MTEQKRCCLQLNMLPVNALNSVDCSDAGSDFGFEATMLSLETPVMKKVVAQKAKL